MLNAQHYKKQHIYGLIYEEKLCPVFM